jgi:hypothetical protein
MRQVPYDVLLFLVRQSLLLPFENAVHEPFAPLGRARYGSRCNQDCKKLVETSGIKIAENIRI